MAPVITIHPLPDTDSFVYGTYGLEPCTVRGIVRIIHDSRYPIKINFLRVKLKGETKCMYVASADAMEVSHRTKSLINEVAPLLSSPETLPPESRLDIPFQINIPDPDHQSDILRAAVRIANLVPPSFAFSSKHSSQPFEASTVYQIVAELEESATLLSFARIREGVAIVEPFVVHDPRLIPVIIQPDSKRWRSAPGDSPIEYEVEISATTLGPGDVFRLAYRFSVAREDAVKGVRIKRVSLLIREHRSLGTYSTRGVVKNSIEIVRWDFDEGAPPRPETSAGSGEREIELGELKPRRKTASGFAGYTPIPAAGLASSSSAPLTGTFAPIPGNSGRRVPYRFADSWSSGPGGDGMYVERDVELKVPSRGNFIASSRPGDPSLIIPMRQQGPPAHVEIKHTLQVRIELSVIHKTVVMECGCVMASVGREECEKLLDESPEVMPTLDYDKIFGNDVWVPPYEVDDPILLDLRRDEEQQRKEEEEACEKELEVDTPSDDDVQDDDDDEVHLRPQNAGSTSSAVSIAPSSLLSPQSMEEADPHGGSVSSSFSAPQPPSSLLPRLSPSPPPHPA
ncbi:hypothetical protein BC829DRAFT_72788 [Chytridium lagenaria]|nr:hypothetical protein BC829DRAFT_72788 [Chytridium lagenaria]